MNSIDENVVRIKQMIFFLEKTQMTIQRASAVSARAKVREEMI